jgi:methylenetetrahydrofolate reductase (NADPH)
MRIIDLFRKERPPVSFEVFPPKKEADFEGIYEILEQLSNYAPDFISVTYGAGGSGAINKTAEIASYIQKKHGIPSLAHLTCVGSKREMIAEMLEDMEAEGIENILALRGDLLEGQTLTGSYTYAADLIRELRSASKFCIGAACYPEGHIACDDVELDLERLHQKQEAGADFFITQLFFDNNLFFRFFERAQKTGITIPISAGVMPFLSRAQIQRMIFMCGASLPSQIIKLLHKYQNDPEDLRKAGIEYAADQIEGLLAGGAEGIHIYTMNRPEIAEYCMRHIGRIS